MVLSEGIHTFLLSWSYTLPQNIFIHFINVWINFIPLTCWGKELQEVTLKNLICRYLTVLRHISATPLNESTLATTVWRKVSSNKYFKYWSGVSCSFNCGTFFKDTRRKCYNSSHILQEFLAMAPFSESKKSWSVIIGLQKGNFSQIHRNKSNGFCTVTAQTSKIKIASG